MHSKYVRIAYLFAVFFLAQLPSTCLAAGSWMAGVARADITPEEPLWLAGYASRDRPAEGTLHALWAKVITIDDSADNRVAMVTLDLIGDNFGRELADRIRARCAATTALAPAEILFNFSHTHSGPVARLNDGATVTYHLDHDQRLAVSRYTRLLEEKLVRMIEAARRSMQPCELRYGDGRTSFAANRRTKLNPDGPVDHTVPVLAVIDRQQQLRAVLFGYACHTASLTGEFYRISGDYAGFAQIALENAHPEATALFAMGCGGDANPQPRGEVALTKQHGETLAAEVSRILEGKMRPLSGPLSVRFGRVDLEFVDPPHREQLLAARGAGSVYQQRLTDVLLERLEERGAIETSYPFPMHVIRFGSDLTLIALGGETVVDYALRLRREFPNEQLWVAGYCNEVFAYVPSERVLGEGGYEGGEAMKYFGIHGPFRPGLEDRIVNRVKELMQNALQP